MKTIIILLTIFLVSGCNTLKDTMHEAKMDYVNFKATIKWYSSPDTMKPKGTIVKPDGTLIVLQQHT